MSDQKLLPSILIIALAACYLIAIVSPVNYPATLWGINHLHYFDWDARIAILIVGLLLSLLVITIGRNVKPARMTKGLLIYLIMPLMILGMFYLLRVRSHYLGDGILRSRETEIGIKLLPTEPLGYYANFLVYQLMAPLFHRTPIQAMEALSYLSGIVFYFAALYFVRVLFRQTEERMIAFVILFFSGTTLLFCGYAETYSLLPALITLFMATGIRSVDKKMPALVPMSLYLLLVLFHFKFLYLAPSLLLLAYYRYKESNKLAAVVGLVALAASLAAVMIIPRFGVLPTIGVAGLLMSFSRVHDSYWMFSGQHLLDVVDQLLLTAIAPLTLILSLVVAGSKVRVLNNPRLLFVGASLPGAIGFVSLLHPALGYASDWDLFSSAGVVLSLFALTFYSFHTEIRLNRVAQVMLSAAAIISFLSFAAVNADFDKAVARQIDILTIAGDYGAIGFETMGGDLNILGKTDLAEQMWKRSARIKPHVRVYANLGQLTLNQGRLDEAEYYLKKGLALDSTQALLIMNLGMTYSRMGIYNLGEDYLRKAVELTPNDAGFHHNLALCLAEQRKFAEAETQSREALRLLPNDVMFMTALGAILSNLGEYAEGESNLLQVIRTSPGYADAYRNLASLYKDAGQIERARQVLNAYLTSFPNSKDINKIKQALEKLNESKQE